jgi:hypothetical protein
MNRWQNKHRKNVEKLVKGLGGCEFYQVFENTRKIILEKCPKGGLRYDIMVL